MAMQTMMRKLGVLVGYSDHTLGIQVPIMAVTLGACLIEKHFTLDRNMPGPDHKASLEPQELKSMVEAIRKVILILGSDIKKPNQSESALIPIVRKSIVASTNIKKGEVFNEKNLSIKRPGNGLSPKIWNNIIGKKAKMDFNIDDLIR
jgi:N,N'-diacetyllegionaminate synthase